MSFHSCSLGGVRSLTQVSCVIQMGNILWPKWGHKGWQVRAAKILLWSNTYMTILFEKVYFHLKKETFSYTNKNVWGCDFRFRQSTKRESTAFREKKSMLFDRESPQRWRVQEEKAPTPFQFLMVSQKRRLAPERAFNQTDPWAGLSLPSSFLPGIDGFVALVSHPSHPLGWLFPSLQQPACRGISA